MGVALLSAPDRSDVPELGIDDLSEQKLGQALPVVGMSSIIPQIPEVVLVRWKVVQLSRKSMAVDHELPVTGDQHLVANDGLYLRLRDGDSLHDNCFAMFG